MTSDVTVEMRKPSASEGPSVGVQTRAQLETQPMTVTN